MGGVDPAPDAHVSAATLPAAELHADHEFRYREACSINYKFSLNVDEGGGEIHQNHNGWIQNLNKGINAQFLLA
jgi:hypothetical protein